MLKRYASIAIVLLFLLFFSASYFYRPTLIEAQAQSAVSNSNTADVKAPNDPKLVMQCESCHGTGKTLPFLAGEKFHKEPHKEYDLGFHAKPANNGKKAASCVDCHTVNGDMSTIMSAANPKSTIFRANISQTCGRCHSDATVMANGNGLSTRPALAYAESVHGKALSRGNLKAAVCTDCHRSHDILPGTETSSPISKFNVALTCGKCHGDIYTEFNDSVHGVSLTRGNYQSPNCTDCHGIHGIKPQKDSRQALGLTGCSQCHDGVRLSQDFGIAPGRVSSFEDSYHGRAMKHGSDVVADCASCHGVHNIRPSTDPKSLIHADNLVATCGQCHIGAGTNFAVGKVHLDTPASQDIGSIGIHWVRNVYLFLIFTLVGGMLVHNGVIWYRKVVAKRNETVRTIQRMSVNQRVQHWMLLTSFIVLVITGFALEYPDGYLGILAGGSEGVRRIIHRVAAVVMMVGGVYHVFYLAFYKEGRLWLWDMLPCWKDFTDLWQNAMYFVFKKGEKPKFARFRYADKAEYWAVVWGTVLMGLTGLMIWFKVGLFSFLPRWAIDIAIAVHFYEAILATLAIVVWHFYHVIFDPDVYPLNWAFYDGKMSEEMFKEEHEQAWEDAQKEEDQEAETAESEEENPHS
ncbi:MAG: cytochrome b/b6 domain-containing protein [Acidobacteria bacterium]|nr:cytochrome b/b6 domain-containing protein [Acidobacteriota bacterium]